MTIVVNKHYEDFDVYIGRGSIWGNPFRIGIDGNRETVIALHIGYLKKRKDLVERARCELAGKRLGCFCKPQACHGDILAFIANGGEIEQWNGNA